MRASISLTAIAMLAATGATAASVKPAFKGANLAPMAKVTLATARATALKARPGTISDQQLEKERGGSGLRYSFDIKAGGRTYEVGIDARTGTVLENGARRPPGLTTRTAVKVAAQGNLRGGFRWRASRTPDPPDQTNREMGERRAMPARRMQRPARCRSSS